MPDCHQRRWLPNGGGKGAGDSGKETSRAGGASADRDGEPGSLIREYSL